MDENGGRMDGGGGGGEAVERRATTTTAMWRAAADNAHHDDDDEDDDEDFGMYTLGGRRIGDSALEAALAVLQMPSEDGGEGREDGS